MEVIQDIFPYLHSDIRDALGLYTNPNEITEIRLRIDKPVIIAERGKTNFLISPRGRPVIVSKPAFMHSVNTLSGGSLYSIEENLKKGFVTIKGGHRVGICGSAVVSDGKVENIMDISALCFRICREILGCAEDIYKDICRQDKFPSCLIASPPGYGKTTILRDLCRLIATDRGDGFALKVGVSDERCEIASMHKGISRFNIGDYSFVCSGYPKTHSMLLMLRSMSPDVIVTDEIGTQDEFCSIEQLQKCGVNVIASIHAFDIEDLVSRYGEKLKCFDSIFFIANKVKRHRVYRRCLGDY